MQIGRSPALWLLASLALIAGGGPLSADEPAAAIRARASFVDSVEVNQIDVEVVVTARGDRRVFDLGRNDFEVFEDGRPVEITHFRAPPLPAAPVRQAAESPPLASPGAVAAAAVSPELPSHLLLFVDTASLRPRHRRELFKALGRSLAEAPRSLRLMLVTYDGRVRVLHGFESPPEEVLATFGAIRRGRLTPRAERGRLAADLAAAETELRTARTPASAAAARDRRDSALAELQPYAADERLEGLRKLEVLRQLAFGLGGIAGRKTLLYAGDNLTMAPAADLYAAAGVAYGEPGSAGGPVASASRPLDLYHDFTELVRQANASGVSFYTLTPPSEQHLGDVAIGRLGPPGFESSIHSEREARVKEAACLMSQATGGRCQAGGTDFRLLIDDALEDLTAVYSLGYVPDREPDGRFHRIEVRVKRGGLAARHREGYVDRTPGDRLRERLAAALWFEAEVDELGVELVVGEQTALGNNGRFRVPVRIEVPSGKFVLLPSSDPETLTARGRILVLAATPDGRTTASETIPLSIEVDAAEYAAGGGPGYAHLLNLDFRRGSQSLAIGVWDEVGRQGSFLSRVIVVGEAKAE